MVENIPIMSKDDERFMAYSGLVQWAHAVVVQADRGNVATARLRDASNAKGVVARNHALLLSEHHYFVIAANKLLEYREWAKRTGLFSDVDFCEIDSVCRVSVRDLRNMREHVVDYFQGNGRDKDRWTTETPEFKADASSCVGTLIGGRLDYIDFANMAQRILPALLSEPIPYPSSQ